MRHIFLAWIFFAACSQPNVKTQFDKLEKVFEAGNWKVTTLDDTYYMFFSREGDALYKVHHYMLRQGDSVNSTITTIRPEKGKIVWEMENEKFELKDVDENGSSWQGPESGNFVYRKQDSFHVSCKWNQAQTYILVRTLPISTFLVRSKYDFLHGTNTANAIVDTVRGKR
jgi:hypothetical protein